MSSSAKANQSRPVPPSSVDWPSLEMFGQRDALSLIIRIHICTIQLGSESASDRRVTEPTDDLPMFQRERYAVGADLQHSLTAAGGQPTVERGLTLGLYRLIRQKLLVPGQYRSGSEACSLSHRFLDIETTNARHGISDWTIYISRKRFGALG